MKPTRAEYEKALRGEILNYSARQKEHWQRSYLSLEKYLHSVQNNRLQWQTFISGIESFGSNLKHEIRSVAQNLKRIILSDSRGFHCEALLALPDSSNTGKFPLVLCLHGIGGSPEMVMGDVDTDPPSYHAYGQSLLESGFAVLAPKLVNNFRERAKLNRMSLLLGSSIWGIELQIIRQLIDLVTAEFSIDENNIAVWGHSLGGAYTLYLMPVEERIRVGIISAWFNARLKKMIVADDRYTCFLPTAEEHVFLPGLLTGYSDQDLLSLILPRPLLIQTGKQDNIAWPEFVAQEFQAAKYHYQQLHLEDRLQWLLHPGGHEIHVSSGIAFLKKHSFNTKGQK